MRDGVRFCAIRKPIVTVHLYHFYALVATVALHLAAVILTGMHPR
jgi:hypothetical protein